MGKLFKIIGILVGFVVLVLAALGVYLSLFFDPNDYRDQLTGLVKEQTGRTLTLEGNLGLSVFPWLGIKVGAAELGNAPGFGDQPFARIGSAEARVKLLPLLRKEVEVDTVALNGLVLNLARDKSGKTNWDDLVASGGAPAKAEKPAQPAEASGPGIAALAVSGVELSDARVVWDDRQAGSRQTVEHLNLKSGQLTPGRPFPLEGSLDFTSSAPALKSHLAFTTEVTADPEAQQVNLKGLDFKMHAEGEPVPGGKADVALAADVAADLKQQLFSAKGLTLSVSGPGLAAGAPVDARLNAEVAADLAKQTLAVTGLTLSALGLKASGDIRGEKIIDNALFKGSLKVAEFSPREVIKQLGQPVPETADANVLQKASFTANLEASPTKAMLNGLEMTLDDTHLKGSAGIASFASQAIRFDLTLDGIDADRYLPPPSDQPAAASPGAAAGGAGLDPAILRPLNIDGKLHIGKVKVANLNASDIVVQVKAKDGVVRVNPVGANLYEGKYSGDITLDGRGKTTKLAVDEHLTGIQAGPLLRDLTRKEEKLVGKGVFNAKLQAAGNDPDAMKRTLNGTADFRFLDGAIKGVNIAQMLREAQAKLQGQPPPPSNEPNQTDFTELSGSVKVTDGVARNDDLNMASPLLRVTGAGSADLPREKVDYLVKATVVGTLTGQGGKGLDQVKGVTVPIKVTGAFADPKFALDTETLFKDHAQAKIEEKKQEIQQKATEKVQEQLEKGLKGLFR